MLTKVHVLIKEESFIALRRDRLLNLFFKKIIRDKNNNRSDEEELCSSSIRDNSCTTVEDPLGISGGSTVNQYGTFVNSWGESKTYLTRNRRPQL